jgi:hypothetical protein
MRQSEVAQSIVRQLRLIDPAISAEIGTPERKIIDVVAQQVAERSVDLNQIQGVLDIDSKFGTDLDNFVGLFRFARQQGTFATCFVKFFRNSPSAYRIIIPTGTVVNANTVSNGDPVIRGEGIPTTNILFQTTQTVIIEPGETFVTAPVRATRVGTAGNVSVGEITGLGVGMVAGVTGVTNEIVGQGGVDPETDEELKARFKNTVFRNSSGTHDQYLADALAMPRTTKANVVGPISRYVEAIQVPSESDVNGGNGRVDEWTSALSSIPYSKHIYKDLPVYVVDDQMVNKNAGYNATSPFNLKGYFLRQEIDFVLNSDARSKNKGDAFRQRSVLDETGRIVAESENRPNVTFKSVLTNEISDEVYGLRPGKILRFEHSYMSESSRNDVENGILNCVDVFVNGVQEQYADVVLTLPAMADAFVNNPASIRHYENYRRYGEPTTRPVVGNLFQPLFAQPAHKLPSSITVGDNTFLEGVHYWMVTDVTGLRGTVRARNGIEWNPNIPGQSSGDAQGAANYNGESIMALSLIQDSLEVENRVLRVNGYTYNSNIGVLQAELEGKKQVTTDVLAHEAEMRYFKVDVAIMYSPGATEQATNFVISRSLADFYKSLTFGSYIQLSDFLQVIRQVPGVDNARWSIEALREDPNFSGDWRVPIDSNGQPRWPVVECDINGRPLTRAVAERVRQGIVDETPNWSTAASYDPRDKVRYNNAHWVALNSIAASDPDATPPYVSPVPGEDPELWRETIPTDEYCVDRVYLTGEPVGGSFVLSYDGFSADLVEYVDDPETIVGYGPPTDEIGDEGDIYYDRENQRLYQEKTSSGWGDGVSFSRSKAIDMTLPYDAGAGTIENKLREQLGDFTRSEPTKSLQVTGAGTPDDPWEIRWLSAGPKPKLFVVSGLWGENSWDSDFPLKDNQLPSIPESATNIDTAAGVIVRTKAQNTWDQA